MAIRSRLAQRVESQTKRNIVFTVVGITIIIGLLWKFGVPLLATISYTIVGSKNDEQVAKKSDYIPPPTLSNTYDATNSAQVKISGISLTDATIELYVNDEKVDSTTVRKDNTFLFDAVSLESGENMIKAQAVSPLNQRSNFSNTVTLTYLSTAPELSIDSPSDGSEFRKDDKSIEVKGKTNPQAKVTVNDFWALVDTEGNYTYTLFLKEGDNDIKVVVKDEAGNKNEKSIRVKYTP